MNERIVQALMRAAVVFVVAGLTALGADAANIVDIGVGGDSTTGALVLSIMLAVIQALLKWLGGVTWQMPGDDGRAAAGARSLPLKRPSWLSL